MVSSVLVVASQSGLVHLVETATRQRIVPNKPLNA
jgi:hypothetical protein